MACVAVLGLHASRDAQAFTLTLAFPDGKPMTYGSACSGSGCLERGHGVDSTNASGEVELPDRPGPIEYRRDGIALALAPAGSASGTLTPSSDHATVVLQPLLTGYAPAVDALESDLAARINVARGERGLPAAQLNRALSTAADLQTAWLGRSGAGFDDLSRLHVGPYDTDVAFRLGEVSFPKPGQGGEIAAYSATAAQAVQDWLASPPHRAQLLSPGPLLIGVARGAQFLVVRTHPPCAGCEQGGPGVLLPPAPAAPAPVPSAAVGGTATSSGVSPACGRERLAARRLAKPSGASLVDLRVQVRCLRARSSYVLVVRQGTSGRMLSSRRVRHAGALTLRLRPSRGVRSLRIRLKRDRRVAVAVTARLRR